jgi:small subunit ribosomal protein S9
VIVEDERTEGEPAPNEEEEQPQDAPEPDAPPPQSGEPPPETGQPPQRAEERTQDKAPEPPPGADLEPIALEAEVELDAEERARLEAEAEERARREAEATEERTEEPTPTRQPAKLDPGARFLATGKRKSSIARVIMQTGSGQIEVNRRSLEDYFPRSAHQAVASGPLLTSGYAGAVDVRVRVHGGGTSGQAGAVRHGIARALCEIDPDLRSDLKRRGYLTRDARVKERRKAGLKKARKKPQFSKR